MTTDNGASAPVPTVGAEQPLSIDVTAEGVAVVTYDVPGATMNTLRADFADAFSRVFGEVEANPDVRAAVLISGKRDSFIAGADIDMLSGVRSAAEGERLCRRGHGVAGQLAASKKPIVAAIHGPALGGGLEVALACQARVLSDSPKTVLGFPEVRLGLLPGMNGLQRLASLAGLQVALDHGLTGKNMYARKALKLGVADAVVPASILKQVAIERALQLAESGGRRAAAGLSFDGSGLMELALERNPVGRSVLFRKAREQVHKTTGGHYPAPGKIIDVLEAFARKGFEESQRVEAMAFGELLMTPVARELTNIFFATTALKKDSGVDDPEVKPRRVDKVGVLGAGLMGAGIAYVSIDKGIAVRLKDRDAPAIGRGLAAVAGQLDRLVERKRLSRPERAARLNKLSVTVDYSGMKRVEMVIEAVFEDLELKHRVLREVEEHCKPGVIFASNTSSIPIGRIAEASRAPENVVGMHYFSPVEKMPLLEVIQTSKTAPEVVATAVAVGKRQGKTVIVVNDGVGFYTSRVLGPLMNEASWLLSEGVSVQVIDRAMKAWGWPVGPITLLDEVGIDVAAKVGPIMMEAFGDRIEPPSTVTRLVDDGRKGRKNERGFYLYGQAAKKAGKSKNVDETVYAALGLPVPDPKAPPKVPVAEIQERCTLQLVNEALHCLGEGILRSPRDGDIGAIFGLGFPPFRGGPFRYVDAVGPAEVLQRIDRYHDRHGKRWRPAPYLRDLVKRGGRIYG